MQGRLTLLLRLHTHLKSVHAYTHTRIYTRTSKNPCHRTHHFVQGHWGPPDRRCYAPCACAWGPHAEGCCGRKLLRGSESDLHAGWVKVSGAVFLVVTPTSDWMSLSEWCCFLGGDPDLRLDESKWVVLLSWWWLCLYCAGWVNVIGAAFLLVTLTSSLDESKWVVLLSWWWPCLYCAGWVNVSGAAVLVVALFILCWMSQSEWCCFLGGGSVYTVLDELKWVVLLSWWWPCL